MNAQAASATSFAFTATPATAVPNGDKGGSSLPLNANNQGLCYVDLFRFTFW